MGIPFRLLLPFSFIRIFRKEFSDLRALKKSKKLEKYIKTVDIPQITISSRRCLFWKNGKIRLNVGCGYIHINETQIENPINKGKAVLEVNFPINVLIGTAIIVEIKPVIAAAIPAICPTGSIANALKFPNKKPIAKNCKPKKVNRIPISGFAEPLNNSTYNKEILKKKTSAIVTNFSIPNFKTSVPFKKVEVPIAIAKPAKI